ncbi:hypothetical protein Leryth_024411 [Lithospermum erythrorhizon]|nr:hypothetical protein Leryth_024411 [Lithospermum erythrorhizon]
MTRKGCCRHANEALERQGLDMRLLGQIVFVERVEAIPKMHLPTSKSGTMGYSGEFDREMDAESINPFEQMARDGGLFGDNVDEKLHAPFVLGTPDICAMQQDSSRDLEFVKGTITYNAVG